jgi:hypothetical protein
MTRRGGAKSRGGTRFGGRRERMAYGKRDVRHGKESGKGIKELAEGGPFPLASKEGDLWGEGVV